MKTTLSLLLTAVFLTQNSPVLYAVENAMVKSVRVSAESVYIATDKPVEYKSFVTGQPPRLVVELLGTRLKTLEDIPVNGQVLKRVRTGQFKTEPVSVSRVVLELSQKAAYEITRKGAELAVILGGRPAPARLAVKDVSADAAGVKVIEPSAPARPVELKMEPDPVKPEDLSRESVPVIAPKKAAASRAGYRNIMESLSREPVSFDYNEASVREVIRMMSAKAGVNVIYSDDVSGSITISLNKVPFDEAFKTILDVKSLAAQQVGDNILRIASPQTFLNEQKKAMLQTRVFFLNYSKSAEVKIQVDAVTGAEGRRGNCVVDEANNALIITDTPMGLEETSRLIKSLDRAPKQVLIEVKLVEVSLDSSFDLGVQWSAYGQKNGTYVGAGDAANPMGPAALGAPSNVYNNYASAAAGMAGPSAAGAGGTGVNLPANVVYGAFRLGKIASNYMFDAVITAAAKKGKAKVLSDPKVATLNNKEANINITTQIPYTTSQTSNSTPPTTTTSVTYLTTGIVLRVTPTINSDGRIAMKVNPTVSQPSPSVVPVAGGAPGIDTRSADTNVIVRDGETIVIGGLIHDTQSEGVFKVPLLGDIPILGYLFRKKSVIRSRMELLIFVTPKIIED